MNYTLQFMMRDYVIQNCEDVFGDLELINSYTDVVDESVIQRNNWLMYGSRKPDKYGVEQEAYALTKIYDLNTEQFNEIENTRSNKELTKFLSIQQGRDKLCEIKTGVDALIKAYEQKNKKKNKKTS